MHKENIIFLFPQDTKNPTLTSKLFPVIKAVSLKKNILYFGFSFDQFILFILIILISYSGGICCE